LERGSTLASSLQAGDLLTCLKRSDLDGAKVPRSAVVIDEEEQPHRGELGGVPHQTRAGSRIAVTSWSVIAREVLANSDRAFRMLEAADGIDARLDTAGAPPGWSLAAAALAEGLEEVQVEARHLLDMAVVPGSSQDDVAGLVVSPEAERAADFRARPLPPPPPPPGEPQTAPRTPLSHGPSWRELEDALQRGGVREAERILARSGQIEKLLSAPAARAVIGRGWLPPDLRRLFRSLLADRCLEIILGKSALPGQVVPPAVLDWLEVDAEWPDLVNLTPLAALHDPPDYLDCERLVQWAARVVEGETKAYSAASRLAVTALIGLRRSGTPACVGLPDFMEAARLSASDLLALDPDHLKDLPDFALVYPLVSGEDGAELRDLVKLAGDRGGVAAQCAELRTSARGHGGLLGRLLGRLGFSSRSKASPSSREGQ
jgi:hypothetical protein